MADETARSGPDQVPVLLLKTRSTPTDAYEEIFQTPTADFTYKPQFVPVLRQQFEEDGMTILRGLLGDNRISSKPGASYGGLIFTSQRAVDAFSTAVDDGKSDDQWAPLQEIPVYSVGPATTRALKGILRQPQLRIFGGDCGNGEALAHFILPHYREWYKDRDALPPLLFLVGEQRRDVIPKTLMNPDLPIAHRIDVTELVVYGTGVMESFSDDFRSALEGIVSSTTVWVVVFSPTGCDGMLRGIGWPGKSGTPGPQGKARTFVATIGPTTRDHLQRTFGFVPDVCAETPSPEGVWGGITQYMDERAGGSKLPPLRNEG